MIVRFILKTIIFKFDEICNQNCKTSLRDSKMSLCKNKHKQLSCFQSLSKYCVYLAVSE